MAELCPESTYPRDETIKVDSHGPVPYAGVTIRVEVTRGGDLYAMDDYDERQILDCP